MKKLYLIAGLLAVGGSLFAQTNSAPTTKSPTVITSDHADFDLNARHAIYYDNVRVDDPKMLLTCVRLTGDLTQPGEEAQRRHIVAETNVVIFSVDEKGQTNHATSDKAVYDFKVENGVTNETVTLTGHAIMRNAQGTLTGEPIIWNRVNNHLTAVNQTMVVNASATSTLTGTNVPTTKTNAVTNPKILPVTKTNLPPGTIQNIDRISVPAKTQ